MPDPRLLPLVEHAVKKPSTTGGHDMADTLELACSKYKKGEHWGAAQLLLCAQEEGVPVSRIEWPLSLCVEDDKSGGVLAVMEAEAEKGSALAQYQLGFFHMSSGTQRRNDEQALGHFTKAYEMGYTGALIQVARCNMELGRVRDAARALLHTIDCRVDAEAARLELMGVLEIDKTAVIAAARERAQSGSREARDFLHRMGFGAVGATSTSGIDDAVGATSTSGIDDAVGAWKAGTGQSTDAVGTGVESVGTRTAGTDADAAALTHRARVLVTPEPDSLGGMSARQRASLPIRMNERMLDQEAMKRVEQLLNDEAQSAERTRTCSEVTVAMKRDRSVVERPALELLQSQGFVRDDGIITVSSAKAFLNRFGFKAPRARKATREDYVELLLDIANAAPQGGWSVSGLKKYAEYLVIAVCRR